MKKGAIGLLGAVSGAVAGAAAVFAHRNEQLKREYELDAKNDAILKLYSLWLSEKKDGNNVSDYLEKLGYKKVAIYGMHYLGESLLVELQDTEIKVLYGIDRNADNCYSDIEVYKPDDELEEVDAIIVTAFYYFDEIEQKLSAKMDCPILSIEDILYELE